MVSRHVIKQQKIKLKGYNFYKNLFRAVPFKYIIVYENAWYEIRNKKYKRIKKLY